jgi:hypothetical protein
MTKILLYSTNFKLSLAMILQQINIKYEPYILYGEMKSYDSI